MSFRLIAVLALTASLPLVPAATAAQEPAQRFTAELAAPAGEARIVAGGAVWRCEGTTCTTAINGTRPLRMCRDLQRKTGAVVRFDAAGAALAAEDLARCNG